jgi:hypothetical protein
VAHSRGLTVRHILEEEEKENLNLFGAGRKVFGPDEHEAKAQATENSI